MSLSIQFIILVPFVRLHGFTSLQFICRKFVVSLIEKNTYYLNKDELSRSEEKGKSLSAADNSVKNFLEFLVTLSE